MNESDISGMKKGVGVEYPDENFHRMAMTILEDVFNGVQSDYMTAFVAPNIQKEDDVVKESPVKLRASYPEGVRFSYYGAIGECTRHNGVIVVSSRVDQLNHVVFYGVAYCSPKDVYNKECGKNIAYLDLENDMKNVELDGKKHHKINARILSDIVANADAPSWAENLVALELCSHLYRAFAVEEA